MKYYGIIKDPEHVLPNRLTAYHDTLAEAQAKADSLCRYMFGKRGKVSVDMIFENDIHTKEVRKWWEAIE